MGNLKYRLERLEKNRPYGCGFITNDEREAIAKGIYDSIVEHDNSIWNTLQNEYGQNKCHTVAKEILDDVAANGSRGLPCQT